MKEWRIVDNAGAPYDFGLECWPIYEDEKTAREQLDLARDDGFEPGLHLEVRDAKPWVAEVPADA